MAEQISKEQDEVEELLCVCARSLACMGVSEDTIFNQVKIALDELEERDGIQHQFQRDRLDAERAEEEEACKMWARENFDPFSDIEAVWHPAVKAECEQINDENGGSRHG